MTKLVLYFTYLALIAGQVTIACYCVTQCRWNKWRRYGKTVFFGLGALSSASVAPAVFTEDTLTVSLTGGFVFWSSIPRAIAVMCVAYGLHKARMTATEDVV